MCACLFSYTYILVTFLGLEILALYIWLANTSQVFGQICFKMGGGGLKKYTMYEYIGFISIFLEHCIAHTWDG